jgi:hypothetical protein
MNKRVLKVLLLSLILLFCASSISHAAVKSGDPCKKVGLTSIAGGKKFTCIKSGKKTVWNKGTSIPTVSPKPSTTVSIPSKIEISSLSISKKEWNPGELISISLNVDATSGVKEITGTLKNDTYPLLGIAIATLKSGSIHNGEWSIYIKIPASINRGNYFVETLVTDMAGNSLLAEKLELSIGQSQANPKQSPSPIIDRQSQYIYRFTNGVLHRKIANSNEFTSLDARPESDFDPIRVNAYKNIRSGLGAGSSIAPKFTLDWTIRSSFPQSISEYTKKTIEESALYWNSIFETSINIPVQFVTELDKDYVSSLDMKFSDTLEILDTLGNPGFRSQVPWMGGGGGYWKFQGTYRALVNFQAASYSTSDYFVAHWPTTGPHEFTHLVQDYFIRDLDRTSNWTEKTADLRSYAHFREGSANTIGYALGLPNLGWYSDISDWWVQKFSNQYPNWKPVKTEKDVVELLSACESRFPNEAHELSYPMGSLLYEWVIGTYGLDAYVSLLKNQIKYQDFGDNIKASLGMTKTELYEKAAPYILRTWERAKN